MSLVASISHHHPTCKDSMKMIATNTLVCVCAALLVPLAMGYDEKFDTFDVDKVIADDALSTAYIDCLLGQGACAHEYSEEFKVLLPEVYATACAKCTPPQKVQVRKVVKNMQEKHPDKFLQFKKKFDPNNEYEAKFAAFLIAND